MVTNSGAFRGQAEVDIARIGAAFDGELTVRNHLEITHTGRVSGKIRYARLEVESGGELNGNIAAETQTPPQGAAQHANQVKQPQPPE